MFLKSDLQKTHNKSFKFVPGLQPSAGRGKPRRITKTLGF